MAATRAAPARCSMSIGLRGLVALATPGQIPAASVRESGKSEPRPEARVRREKRQHNALVPEHEVDVPHAKALPKIRPTLRACLALAE